jgi:hypothetical protein
MAHGREVRAADDRRTVAPFTRPAPGIVVRAGTLGGCLAVMDG